MTNLERYQEQLNRLCGKAPKPKQEPQPLTGIQKHQREQDETVAMWRELEKRDD